MPTNDISESSILANIEIKTCPHVTYLSLEEFTGLLEQKEPGRRWREVFLPPLIYLGARDLGDMEIISLESLFVFRQLCPLMIMDFYVHVIDHLADIDVKSRMEACNICKGEHTTRITRITKQITYYIMQGLDSWLSVLVTGVQF
ncbi:hypothetical protein BKA82DRAFT_33739 [Pisolithus tinctorius]|uniref:Uncharacterized protein n=1 Tax=Pisolithus tinctorius Marx 270 TaxID=870435 RepID=A0A0C3NKV2_PISTI|nr:hypothetical protein BKA82DRAFT_33739 [Pisolithus tinctorius]KIN95923.1 hypothetical protein M404DRAFT_33739 [Pisolithus tinctorius Marx 270]